MTSLSRRYLSVTRFFRFSSICVRYFRRADATRHGDTQCRIIATRCGRSGVGRVVAVLLRLEMARARNNVCVIKTRKRKERRDPGARAAIRKKADRGDLRSRKCLAEKWVPLCVTDDASFIRGPVVGSQWGASVATDMGARYAYTGCTISIATHVGINAVINKAARRRFVSRRGWKSRSRY